MQDEESRSPGLTRFIPLSRVPMVSATQSVPTCVYPTYDASFYLSSDAKGGPARPSDYTAEELREIQDDIKYPI